MREDYPKTYAGTVAASSSLERCPRMTPGGLELGGDGSADCLDGEAVDDALSYVIKQLQYKNLE